MQVVKIWSIRAHHRRRATLRQPLLPRRRLLMERHWLQPRHNKWRIRMFKSLERSLKWRTWQPNKCNKFKGKAACRITLTNNQTIESQDARVILVTAPTPQQAFSVKPTPKTSLANIAKAQLTSHLRSLCTIRGANSQALTVLTLHKQPIKWAVEPIAPATWLVDSRQTWPISESPPIRQLLETVEWAISNRIIVKCRHKGLTP